MHRPPDGRENRWRIALAVSIVIHVALLAVMRLHKWPARSIDPPSVPVVVWLPDWQPLTETEELDEQIPDRDEDSESEDIPTESEIEIETQTPELVESSPISPNTPRSPSIDH